MHHGVRVRVNPAAKKVVCIPLASFAHHAMSLLIITESPFTMSEVSHAVNVTVSVTVVRVAQLYH